MTNITSLRPPVTKCLDLAKEANCAEYIVIGIGEDGVPREWSTKMTDIRRSFFLRWVARDAEEKAVKEIAESVHD